MLVCPYPIGGGYTWESLLRSETAERKAESRIWEAELMTGEAEPRTREAE